MRRSSNGGEILRSEGGGFARLGLGRLRALPWHRYLFARLPLFFLFHLHFDSRRSTGSRSTGSRSTGSRSTWSRSTVATSSSFSSSFLYHSAHLCLKSLCPKSLCRDKLRILPAGTITTRNFHTAVMSERDPLREELFPERSKPRKRARFGTKMHTEEQDGKQKQGQRPTSDTPNKRQKQDHEPSSDIPDRRQQHRNLIEELEKTLSQQEDDLEEANRSRDQAVHNLTNHQNGHDNLIIERNEEVRLRRSAEAQRDTAIEQRNAAVEKYKLECEKSKAAKQDYNNAVLQRIDARKERATAIEERNEAMQERDTAIRHRDIMAENHKAAIKERDAAIEEARKLRAANQRMEQSVKQFQRMFSQSLLQDNETAVKEED
ncbi:hypothetical protein IWZ01DRAFT_574728 [Phyllosticta capitalensis]